MSVSNLHGLTGNNRFNLLIVGGVLFFLLAVTGALFLVSNKIIQDQLIYQFQQDSKGISIYLETRINEHANITNGERGLFAASKGVEQEEWKAYIDALDLPRNYPDVSSAIYLQRVTRADIGSYPNKINPVSDKAEYYPITFIEPQTPDRLAVIGFDISSEEQRRITLETSRDTGKPTATPVVNSVSNQEPSFTVYSPIYLNGAPLETVDQRRQALTGFVGTAFRVNQLFTDLINDKVFPQHIDMEVFDAPGLSESTPSKLIYDIDQEDPGQNHLTVGPLAYASTIIIGGRTWTIFTKSLPNYVPDSGESKIPLIILIIGIALSTLIAWLIYSYALSGERAASLAAKLTRNLQESKNELTEYIDQMSTFNLKVDTDGRILLFNKPVPSVSGIPEEQIYKTNFLEIPWWNFDKSVMNNVRRRFHQVLETKTSVVFGERVKIANGDFLFLNTSFVPVLDKQGQISYIVAEGRDITALKKIEDELKQSESRLKEAEHTALLGSWELDLVSNILTWSDEIYRIFEISREDLKATYEGFLDLIYPEDRKLVDRIYKESVVKQTPYSIDHRLLSKKGQMKYIQEKGETYFDPTGKPLRTVGTIQDITERKKVEIELQASRLQIEAEKAMDEAILSSIGDGVIVADQSGKFVLFNKSAEKILGIGSKEVDPQKWSDLYGMFYPDQKTRIPMEDLPLMHALKGESVERTVIFIRNEMIQNGIFTSADAKPVKDTKGNLLGAVVIFRDITKEKDLERIKDEFVSVASHELRTPMGAIKSLTSTVLAGDYGVVPEEIKDPLLDIQTSSERLIKLVNEMLNISRIEAGRLNFEISDTDIIPIVTEVVKEIRPIASDKKLTLEIKHIDDSKVSADADKIKQILNNLIGNSLKFTENGGLSVYTKIEGDFLNIYIADTGIGISTEDQTRLFGKFQQISSQQIGKPEGTGLGLYFSRELARKMGGDLWLESSTLGKGSLFAFSLPLENSQVAIKVKIELNKGKIVNPV